MFGAKEPEGEKDERYPRRGRAGAPESPQSRRFRRWLLAQMFFLCLALLAFLLSLALRDLPHAVAILSGANIGFGIAAVLCALYRRRAGRR